MLLAMHDMPTRGMHAAAAAAAVRSACLQKAKQCLLAPWPHTMRCPRSLCPCCSEAWKVLFPDPASDTAQARLLSGGWLGQPSG